MECVPTFNSRQPRDQNEQFETCSPDNGPGAVFDSLNFSSEETDWDLLNLELRKHAKICNDCMSGSHFIG